MDAYSPTGVLEYFLKVNGEEGDWNYKNENIWNQYLDVPYLGVNGKFLWEGIVITAEDLGNINYGFVGTYMGFEEDILYAGGGYANYGHQITAEMFSAPYFGDNANDHVSIKMGIYYYNNGMRIDFDEMYAYIFN